MKFFVVVSIVSLIIVSVVCFSYWQFAKSRELNSRSLPPSESALNTVHQATNSVSTNVYVSHPTRRLYGGTDTFLDSASLTNEEKQHFIDIAYEVARHGISIENKDNNTFDFTEDFVFITFNLPPWERTDRPRPPGPDFIAWVQIDRKTGEIIDAVRAR